MAKEFTDAEKSQRLTYAILKANLNCAERLIEKIRDEFVDVEPVLKTEALTFAKNKVISLNTKFKDLV
jgi:hypothetical protein